MKFLFVQWRALAAAREWFSGFPLLALAIVEIQWRKLQFLQQNRHHVAAGKKRFAQFVEQRVRPVRSSAVFAKLAQAFLLLIRCHQDSRGKSVCKRFGVVVMGRAVEIAHDALFGADQVSKLM